MNKSVLIIVLAVLLAASTSVFAQTNYLLSDPGTSGNTFEIVCGDNSSETNPAAYLYDSGNTGNYSSNENYIREIASTNSGSINIKFTQFNLASGTVMTIKDAISQAVLVSNASSTQLNGQTFTSNRGALQIIWSSGSTTGAGFIAKVWCGQACETYYTDITPSVDARVEGGNIYYDVCQNTAVTFTTNSYNPNTSASYGNVTRYDWAVVANGSDTTWFENAGPTFTHTFTQGGGYHVLCDATNASGCFNRNINTVNVRVSLTAAWESVTFGPDSVCPGSIVTFTGQPRPVIWEGIPPAIIAGQTFLPDGNGTCYNTSLSFENFEYGRTIQSIDDIDRIYLNMEHSYLGDLSIMIQCPNGQNCLLKAYSTTNGTVAPGWHNTGGVNHSGSSSGGGTHLGLAPDPSSTNNACYYTAGEGYSYNFTPNGTNSFGSGGPTTSTRYTDPCGNSETSSVLNEGDYASYEGMSALIGCPLNGIWTIYVCDHLSLDNGYIFEWGLFFRSDLYPAAWEFSSTYAQSGYSWSGEGMQSGQNGSATATAAVQNPDADNWSEIPYTFTVTDNFGCQYDTTVTVHVKPAHHADCCIPPTPVANAGDTQPCGNSTTLDAGSFAFPVNTGEWTYTGPGTATFSSPTQPQTTVTVNVYGDYTFTWHEYYMGNQTCNGEASVNVNFARPHNPTLTSINDTCRSGQIITLTAADFGDVTCTYNGQPYTGSALNAEARTFTPTLATPGNYTITNSIPTTERCATPRSHSQSFTIYDEITVSDRTEICGTGAQPMVTVTFNINGVVNTNQPPSYNISGTYTAFAEGTYGTPSPNNNITVNGSTNHTYSFSANSELDYLLTVSDIHGCSSAVVQGYYACDCPNRAGTFDDYTAHILCTGETYTIGHNHDDEEDQDGGIFSYVVCTDLLDIPGSAMTPSIPGTATEIGLATFNGSYNTQYYLVAIAGYGAGVGAWGNGCRSVSPAVPLLWKETPVPSASGDVTCGLVMTLNGSAPGAGMAGYWTATGPEGVTNYSYTTIENTDNTMNNAVVLSSHYGIATYTWNVANSECVGHASAQYNFRRVPTPEAGPDMTVCGVSAEITGASQTIPLIADATLQWTASGVTMSPASSIQPTANANAPGTYVITLTERNGDCVGSDDLRITFINIPAPVTTANVDTVCGHVAELQVYNANPENEGRWTAYDMFGNVLPVVSYQQYGNPSAPSNDRYTHCYATVPIPDDQTEIEYEFRWSEPISDPRLPEDATCNGVASKFVVFRKVPAISVHECGATGNHTVVCGKSIELCAETSASDGYSSYSWVAKELTGRFDDDSLTNHTTYTLDSTVSITRYTDAEIYFIARNASCMTIDTMHVRFLQKPTANAGNNHVACGRDYVLHGEWTMLPSDDYTPTCQWTTISKPAGALDPTWTNTPHDSIVEPVRVNGYGVYQFQLRETNTAGGASNCYDLDTVTVEFMEQPVVDAGRDFEVCGLDFQMNATTSHVDGDSISGSWMSMGGGTATFTDRTDPHTTGHFSAYGPVTFRWTETNHPHIETTDPESCAAWDEVVVTFYEVPSAAINMNAADTATCGLTTSFFLQADPHGDDISGYWYEENPSTVFGAGNSIVTDATVSSYGYHDFYWIEYNGPSDNPRFCKDTAGPWTVLFLQEPSAQIAEDEMTFCSQDGQLHVNFNGVGVGLWSASVPSSVVSFGDPSSPNSSIHSNIWNSLNPSYPYFTLYWAVQNTQYCTDEDSIKVIFAHVPSDSIMVIPPKCFGEAAILTAYEDSLAIYDWEYGTGIIDSVATNAVEGGFRTFIHWDDKEETHIVGLTTTNHWGCQSSIGREIVTEPTLPEYSYNIIMDTCSLGRGGIEFLDTTGLFAFFWIDTTVGPTITNPITGYALTDFHVYNIPAGRYTYRADYQSFNRDYFVSYQTYFNDVYCHDFPEVEVGTIGMIEAEIAISPEVVGNLVIPNRATAIFYNTTNYDNLNNKICEWHFGDDVVLRKCDSIVEHIYNEPGCYEPYLVVMNRNIAECRDTAFLDECVLVGKESKLEVPNIFSPNGDGINDYFQVKAQTLKSFHGTILNRYGNVMFEWDDWETEEAGWDGSLYGSTKATPGVYFYVIEAEGLDGVIYSPEGAFNLVK